MKITSSSLFCLVLALGSGASLATLPGCSSTGGGRGGTPSDAVGAGRLALPLTASGASGSVYRLRDAVFQISATGAAGGVTLFSEDDPLSTTLEATLGVGGYVIELLPGWGLERVQGGVSTRVAAELSSPSVQAFDIAMNGETRVSYRIATNGDVVDVGQGRLIVSLEVEERSGSGAQLGAPLEIVSGVVSPGSNPHGIQAVVYADAAPIGSSITLSSSTGSICVNGDIAPVIGDDFTDQWGVELGLAFLSESLAEPAPWDLDGGRVTGFAFTLEGSSIPETLRFRTADGAGDTGVDFHYCRPFAASSGDTLEMPFDALDFQCWMGIDAPFAGESALVIAWNIPSDPFSSHPFDFCVKDVRPMLGDTAPEPLGPLQGSVQPILR